MALKCEIFLDGKNTKIRTLEDISFNIHGIIYTVPAGFVSDGCSLPRFFWRLIGNPLQADWIEEAVLHDWLYKFQPVSRREADKIFFMVLNKPILRIRRYLIYIGLRLGGWIAWNNHKKALGK